jgi:beta-fructofuranosidase
MQPLALQSNGYDILGGSAVIDKNNTSGVFPNQTNGVVAVYTQHHPVTRTLEQAIAYSTDGGYIFIRYSKNAVLRFSEGNQDLRDPKVIWHEPTQRWVMTAAKVSSGTIGIYTSPNLIDWAAASDFTNQDLVNVGHGFEYPNLVPIPRIDSTGARNPNLPTVPGGTIQDFGDYILLSSSSRGSPLNGGSITRYFPGKFNGTHFEPINNRTDRFIDFGPDNYASQFFFGLPDGAPVVSLGLASNFRYTTSSQPARPLGQTSMFTGPRVGYLIHGPGEGDLSYFSRPFGLDSLRGESLANFSSQQVLDRSVFYNGSEAVLVEARLEMQPPDDEMVELNVDFIFRSSKSSEQILCTTVFRTWTADFGCDRSQAISKWSIDNSLLNQMSARQVQPLLPYHNPAVRRWEVQAIMDRSILEVFLNNGVKVGTVTIFSETPIDSIYFQGSKIPTWATLSVNVQRLRPEKSA